MSTAYRRYCKPEVSILRYGADAAGVVDATVAIQAAIDYIESLGGGEVFVPKGLFLVGTASRINLKSNVSIIGTGNESRIKLANTSPIASSQGVFYGNGVSDITISKLYLDGNRANQPVQLISGIKTDGGGNLTVRDCYFATTSNNAVYFSDGCINGYMLNNTVVDPFGTSFRIGGNDAALYCQNIIIHGNISYNTTAFAQQFDGFITARYLCRDIMISNNTFVSISAVLMSIGMWFTSDIKNINIIGNVMRDIIGPSVTGIRIDGPFTNVGITGNTFSGISQTISCIPTSSGTGLNISGNNIMSIGSYGVAVTPTAATSITRVIVSNNLISGTTANQAIRLEAYDCVVTGNVVEHAHTAAGHAVYLTGNRNVITGNYINCFGAVARGIEFYGNYNMISGNTIKDTGGTFAIRQATAGNFKNSVIANLLINTGGVSMTGEPTNLQANNNLVT